MGEAEATGVERTEPTRATEPVELLEAATTAELQGRHDEAVAALQQAFVDQERSGDLHGAVRSAFRLAMATASHGEPALSAGWAARAEGLVAEIGEDCAGAGWVAILRMFHALGSGAFPDAGACAEEALAAGRRHHDGDLVAMATCSRGRMALYSGDVEEGLACLDEAMVRVVTGEVSPMIAGHVYCTAIEGCQEIGDFGRVAEWTSALERWCAAQPGLLTFTGQCAVHRGQLLRLQGEWNDALAELERAVARYDEAGTPDAAGLAAYEAGEVLRLQGDRDAAEAAYQRAADHGFDPQPGLALLWLAHGQGTAARQAVVRLLAEPAGPVQRLRLLPAAVDVLLGTGDQEGARAAADELGRLSRTYACPVVESAAARACGAVELAAGDPAGALPYLRRAERAAARAGDAHGRARARVLLGRALTATGDPRAGRHELGSARTAFRRVGARPDADAVSALLAPADPPGGLTAREVEVLRLVATGRSNAQIAGELVLSDKTVARHLSNIFTKLDVGSRTAATAFAFEHGLV